jgi:UPF0271 protein
VTGAAPRPEALPKRSASRSTLLNLDAGEHADEPVELWQLADIVAIACGGHAGDASSMARVIAACETQWLAAHPSYPDREHFGRRSLTMSTGQLAAAIHQQWRALVEIAEQHGRRVEWVKPHGALYHDAARDPEIARAVIAIGVGVIGPPRGALHDLAVACGLPYLREGFADRALRSDGSLVPRGEPGALITDPAEAAAQARRLAVDTVCVHADTPGALSIARAVSEALRGGP